MTIINKETKTDLAKAIQHLYVNTLMVNQIAGNKICKELIPNQLETVKAELKETQAALDNNNLGELADGCCDLLVTLSFLVMLEDGNESLIKNPPKYLNEDQFSVEDLVEAITECVEHSNYIDALGYTEDMAAQLNADMIANCYEVAESNSSKFITLEDLDASEHTEFSLIEEIEAQGRYTDVYTETTMHNGQEWVVFKSKYDQENNEHYPAGKFIKPPHFFKEPTIIVYDD